MIPDTKTPPAGEELADSTEVTPVDGEIDGSPPGPAKPEKPPVFDDEATIREESPLGKPEPG